GRGSNQWGKGFNRLGRTYYRETAMAFSRCAISRRDDCVQLFWAATNESFSEKRPMPGSPTRDSSPSAKLRLKSHSLMEKKNPRRSCVGTAYDKSGRRSAKHAVR